MPAVQTRVEVKDDFGQVWVVYPDDDLWEDANKVSLNGGVLPLALIIQSRGWGWWSCFKKQDEWLQQCGVPVPDHKILDNIASVSPGTQPLLKLLEEFGAYVSFLEAQIGLMEGRKGALKQGYESAMLVACAEFPHEKSEKAKEGKVLATNETLRQVRRMWVETDTLISTAKGLMDAYQRAWETVSRVLTARIAENEITSSRRTTP